MNNLEKQKMKLDVEKKFQEIIIPRIQAIEKIIKDEQRAIDIDDNYPNSVSIGGPTLEFDSVTGKQFVSKITIDGGINVVPYCNLTVYSAGDGNISFVMTFCNEKKELKKTYQPDDLTIEVMNEWTKKFYDEYKRSR